MAAATCIALRGSDRKWGFPDGWMSPWLLSTGPVGRSSGVMALAAVSRRAPPGWIDPFLDWVTSGGSQPTSSSSPMSTSRSAFRSFTARDGLGSTKCGSCTPRERLVTFTLSPPTSRTRAASPSVLVTTSTAATAGAAREARSPARASRMACELMVAS